MVEPTKSWKKSLRDESNPDGLNWWAEAIHMLSVWNNPANQEGVCNVAELYESAANKDEAGTIAYGTHVAGIIAGQAGNGVGITGISQNAELYGFSILSETAFESSDYAWGDIFMYKVAFSNLLKEGVKVIKISKKKEPPLPCYGIYNGAESLLQEPLLKYAKKRKQATVYR